MHPPQDQPSLIERVERSLVLLAVLIELDGDVHVPMYERFEAELKALRSKEGTKARARRLLDSYNRVDDAPRRQSRSSIASSWVTTVTALHDVEQHQRRISRLTLAALPRIDGVDGDVEEST